FPPGVVSRVPFQYPLKSGCPSAVRGAGFRGPVGLGAVRLGSTWATAIELTKARNNVNLTMTSIRASTARPSVSIYWTKLSRSTHENQPDSGDDRPRVRGHAAGGRPSLICSRVRRK